MKKVMKDLAPIALPHGPPVECAEEYYKSLMESANMVKKYPVWDVARPTPQVLMEQARRDLMDADEKLALKRVEEQKNRVIMDAKWEELRQKEMMLKESFISFNKFIRENQEKRERAERKMAADAEVLERKTRETDAMRERVLEMEEVKALMEKQVKDYTIYEDYLMAVVHSHPEFKQPLDVLNRYEALAAAKSTLAERQERDLEMLENARQEIANLTEEKKLFIMGLNNTLANLRWRYDKVRNRVIKWELALNRLKETAARRHVELCHVKSAIWSLYTKICKQKGLTIDVKPSDFEQQLVVIMRALLELRRIYRIAAKRSKEKDASSMGTQ
ncbi:coiled-coil domain-containing protein 42 homolog [Amyelois transitella]|uniref:coiled-coil domain-containing protein 42 homolog n=1 Tax=Amyelois transitella TaxID=680683 RepID=UPI00067DA4B9|nr:coiled-coil domain-containing protein 42 homolog [Amyelois transitella]XP_060806676.1 coiled-coil domain-containing protein 42 homolog [Amyelois transitella]